MHIFPSVHDTPRLVCSLCLLTWKLMRAWVATTIIQSINYIQPSPSSPYSIWAQGNLQNQCAPLLGLSSLVSLDVLLQMNHETLAVLCSLWPGRGVRRRLGWCHPLRAQRQRWMRSWFGMCWCGWVIGHCERPWVKISRWEWDAFICAQGPSTPSSSCCSVPFLLSFILSLSLKPHP